MKSQFAALVAALVLAAPALAHDEGHGPKVTDAGRMGGVVTSVIDAKETKLGPKAALVYKAELVRASDGTVRVYLYDKDMKPMELTGFEASGSATLEDGHGKKGTKTDFAVALEGKAFSGKAPKAKNRPFNIDVKIKQGDRLLLAAFDNLD